MLPLAAAQGVADRVFVHEPVTYKASLALQTSADVLLLLQWDNVKDAGNIPAKFYEYLGARRPILFLGYEAGDLAATGSRARGRRRRQRPRGDRRPAPAVDRAEARRHPGPRCAGARRA